MIEIAKTNFIKRQIEIYLNCHIWLMEILVQYNWIVTDEISNMVSTKHITKQVLKSTDLTWKDSSSREQIFTLNKWDKHLRIEWIVCTHYLTFYYAQEKRRKN